MDNKADMLVIAPDGGWGWMIALSDFMVNFIVDGVIGCFGLIYPDLIREFKSSPSLTSMAGSLIVGTYMCSSLLVGGLIRRFGCRKVSMIGGIVGAVGCCLSMFSQNLVTFMMLYGVVAGIGFSMNSLPGHLMINTYFNKKRGLANGLAISGAGVGVFLMAPLIQFTLGEYGWRGTILICGGIVLNFCVCGALMRPLNPGKPSALSKHNGDSSHSPNEIGHDAGDDTAANKGIVNTKSRYVCVQNNESPKLPVNLFERPNVFLTPDMQRKSNKFENPLTRKLMNERTIDANSLPDLKNLHLLNTDNSAIKHKVKPAHILNDPFRRKDVFYSGSLYHLKEFKETNTIEEFIGSMTICDRDEADSNETETDNKAFCLTYFIVFLKQLCDISIFQNRLFIPVLIGAIGIQMSQFIPNTFIAAYCYTIDLKDSQISLIVSIFGASNIVGRLSAGCLANLSSINTLWLFNFGVFMCGVACTVFPLCTTFPSVCGFSAGLGYFMGYFPPLQILVLVEYIGIEKLTSSLGFVQLAKGFAAVAGPPLAGIIYEWTQSYGTAVQFAGVLSFIAVFAQSLVPFLDMCSNRNNRRQPSFEINLPETKQMLFDN